MGMSWMEWVAAGLTILAVWLTARQNMLCWPVGIASAALYIWIFHESLLFSDALLQAFFFVLQIYGWWAWRQNPTATTGQRPVTRASTRQLVLFGIGGAIAFPLWGRFVLAVRPDASLPYHDAAVLIFSLIFQYWMSRKVLECWIGWTVVNVLQVWIYSVKGLHPTAALYALLTGLAVKGWYDWRLEPGAPAGREA